MTLSAAVGFQCSTMHFFAVSFAALLFGSSRNSGDKRCVKTQITAVITTLPIPLGGYYGDDEVDEVDADLLCFAAVSSSSS